MWRKVPAASSFKPNCPCPARSPRTRLATAVLLLGFLALVLVLKTGEMSHVLNLLVCPAPLPPPHRYPPADAGGWPAHTPPPLCVLPADVLQAAKSLAASHAMINVVFFDSAYLLLTKNWLCNVRAIPGYISRTLLVALDRAALEGLNAFAAHNDVRLDPRQHVLLPWTQAGGAKQYGDVAYWKLMTMRTGLELQLLLANISFLNSETDVVYSAQSPWPHLDRAREDIVSINDHDLPGRTCITGGFVAFRPSPRAIQTLADTYEEQLRLLHTQCRAGARVNNEQVLLTKHAARNGLRVGFLDPGLFRNGLSFESDAPGALVRHNNWVKGGEFKMLRAQQHRGWFLASSPDWQTCA